MKRITYIVCTIKATFRNCLVVTNETVVGSWFHAIDLARRTSRRIIRETADTVVVYDRAYHS